MIKTGAEIKSKPETQRRIKIETKSWFFANVNTIDKCLVRYKRENTNYQIQE